MTVEEVLVGLEDRNAVESGFQVVAVALPGCYG